MRFRIEMQRPGLNAAPQFGIFPLRMRTAVLIAAFVLSMARVAAQGSAGEGAAYEPRYLIDLPTAGVIPHGTLALDMDFTAHGALLATCSVGLWGRVTAGLSY